MSSPEAMILHGGGDANERLRHLIPSAAGVRTNRVWGYPPQGNFEKIGYLRQHFVHFEDGLFGNKVGKSERHKMECIIETYLESHNLVQNKPHESKWWTFNPKAHIEC